MKFYSDISELYEHIFPFRKAQHDFVLSNEDIGDKSIALDIGCGIGDLSFQIAKNINHLTAIDLSSAMIKRAKAKNLRSNLDFYKMNMMDTEIRFPDDHFDLIYSFGNTLVHLLSKSIISKFLHGIEKKLKPGGLFLIQILNYEHIIEVQQRNLPLIENETLIFEREYEYPDDGLILFKTKLNIKQSNQEFKNEIPLFPIKRSTINELLYDNGFTAIKFYSSFKGLDFDSKSLPLILSCRKKRNGI